MLSPSLNFSKVWCRLMVQESLSSSVRQFFGCSLPKVLLKHLSTIPWYQRDFWIALNGCFSGWAGNGVFLMQNVVQISIWKLFRWKSTSRVNCLIETKRKSLLKILPRTQNVRFFSSFFLSVSSSAWCIGRSRKGVPLGELKGIQKVNTTRCSSFMRAQEAWHPTRNAFLETSKSYSEAWTFIEAHPLQAPAMTERYDNVRK